MATKKFSKDSFWLWLSTPKFTCSTDLIVFKDEFGADDFNNAIIINPASILSKFNGEKLTTLLRWCNKKWPGEVKSRILPTPELTMERLKRTSERSKIEPS